MINRFTILGGLQTYTIFKNGLLLTCLKDMFLYTGHELYIYLIKLHYAGTQRHY